MSAHPPCGLYRTTKALAELPAGRLVYFQLWKEHIGLYALGAPVLAAHKSELEGAVYGKGTVRLPLDSKLPVALIKELVKAQVKMKDEGAKKK